MSIFIWKVWKVGQYMQQQRVGHSMSNQPVVPTLPSQKLMHLGQELGHHVKSYYAKFILTHIHSIICCMVSELWPLVC